MKLMIPLTPHLAYECLDLLSCKDVNIWPDFDKSKLLDDIKLAVQVNGKTRDIITIKKDLLEKEISNIVLKESKAKKHIIDKKIIKTVFVRNKIINYIVLNKWKILLYS